MVAMASLIVMSVMSSAVKDGDAAPLLVVHHVDGVQAVALAENAIVGGGNAAALGVAEVHGAGFEAGLLLDEIGERFANAGEARVAEGVDLRGADDLADFRQMAALRDHHHAVVLAVIVVVFEQRADVVDVDFFFGNEDDMGAAGDARGIGDPARVAAHHFNDDDAVVRVGRGVDAVDGLGGDHDGGVVAEGLVGAADIVVDGLGNADAR